MKKCVHRDNYGEYYTILINKYPEMFSNKVIILKCEQFKYGINIHTVQTSYLISIRAHLLVIINKGIAMRQSLSSFLFFSEWHAQSHLFEYEGDMMAAIWKIHSCWSYLICIGEMQIHSLSIRHERHTHSRCSSLALWHFSVCTSTCATHKHTHLICPEDEGMGAFYVYTHFDLWCHVLICVGFV